MHKIKLNDQPFDFTKPKETCRLNNTPCNLVVLFYSGTTEEKLS